MQILTPGKSGVLEVEHGNKPPIVKISILVTLFFRIMDITINT